MFLVIRLGLVIFWSTSWENIVHYWHTRKLEVDHYWQIRLEKKMKFVIVFKNLWKILLHSLNSTHMCIIAKGVLLTILRWIQNVCLVNRWPCVFSSNPVIQNICLTNSTFTLSSTGSLYWPLYRKHSVCVIML